MLNWHNGNAFSTKEQSFHYQQIEKYLSARLYSVCLYVLKSPVVNFCNVVCFGAKKGRTRNRSWRLLFCNYSVGSSVCIMCIIIINIMQFQWVIMCSCYSLGQNNKWKKAGKLHPINAFLWQNSDENWKSVTKQEKSGYGFFFFFMMPYKE